jgi:(p)ppGpp synthase/HD superfamily hydrolase
MTLEDAIAVAAQAHKGQRDKAGQPYILHPLRVMNAVQGEHAKMTAVLHDVVEDTSMTLVKLRARGLPKEVAAAVEALTRRAGESYLDFVDRAGRNPMAWAVKLADLKDNLNPLRLGIVAEKHRKRLRRKYGDALKRLGADAPKKAKKAKT